MGLIFGWDVSTSVVGTVVLTEDGQLTGSSYLDLTPFAGESLVSLTHRVATYAAGLGDRWASESTCHFVEDRLGGFSRGFTNQQTLLKLASFNSSVSYAIWDLFRARGETAVRHLHPSTAKSLMRSDGFVVPKGADKKALALEHLLSVCGQAFSPAFKRTGKPRTWCYDVADAYLVGRAGYLLLCRERGRCARSSARSVSPPSGRETSSSSRARARSARRER